MYLHWQVSAVAFGKYDTSHYPMTPQASPATVGNQEDHYIQTDRKEGMQTNNV
jgi:hypothetical protein